MSVSQCQQDKVNQEIALTPTMVTKIHQDIGFLKDKIEKMKAQKKPNPHLLDTYTSMLESRESVMGWIERQNICDRQAS